MIHFSENSVSDILEKIKTILHQDIMKYNQSCQDILILIGAKSYHTFKNEVMIEKFKGDNEPFNELFN